MKRLGLLFLMIYTASGGVANAATYYVSKTGSDSSSCAQSRSISTPKLTINAGVQCLTAGDTLLVRAGNYDEGLSSVPSGTSWSNPVTIAAYPAETVWIKPLSRATSAGGLGTCIWLDGPFSYIDFNGINLDNSSLSIPQGESGNVLLVSTNNGNNPNHIRFQNATIVAGQMGGSAAVSLGGHTRINATGSNEILNVTIHGGGLPSLCGFQCNSYGIYIAGPNNVIDGCNIYDTSAAGIQIYNAGGDQPNNNIIRNTTIHDITRTGSLSQVWGIEVVGSNNLIYNNIIYHINVGALNINNAAINVTANGNMIYNNTVYNNTNTGIHTDPNATNTQIMNNIAYLSTGNDYLDQGTGTVQSHNLIGVNPLVVNASANNFQLQPASPAVNAGTTVAVVTTDVAGVLRPQGSAYDIGAYELANNQIPAPTNVHILGN